MIDMELAVQARANVERRRADELNAEIAAEQFAIDHRRQMAAAAANIVDMTERQKQVRQSRHAAAVVEARAAREHLEQMTGQTLKVSTNLGAVKAFKLEAQKARARLAMACSSEEYPTKQESAFFTGRLDESDRELFRLEAMIQVGAAELSRAQIAEDEANAAFQRLSDLERKARNEL